MLVVDGYGVCGSMALLIVGNHHGYLELRQSVTREGDADVATDQDESFTLSAKRRKWIAWVERTWCA